MENDAHSRRGRISSGQVSVCTGRVSPLVQQCVCCVYTISIFTVNIKLPIVRSTTCPQRDTPLFYSVPPLTQIPHILPFTQMPPLTHMSPLTQVLCPHPTQVTPHLPRYIPSALLLLRYTSSPSRFTILPPISTDTPPRLFSYSCAPSNPDTPPLPSSYLGTPSHPDTPPLPSSYLGTPLTQIPHLCLLLLGYPLSPSYPTSALLLLGYPLSPR